MKYALAEETDFQDDEHCKAWLIKVSSNVCRDMLRAAHRKDHSFDRETESPCCCEFLWMKTQRITTFRDSGGIPFVG